MAIDRIRSVLKDGDSEISRIHHRVGRDSHAQKLCHFAQQLFR